MGVKVEYRAGDEGDSYSAFEVFEHTFADLNARLGSGEATSASEDAKMARMWAERRSLYHHLARTADQFWLAEREGQTLGFARSVRRDNVRQLTEFFVLPGQQSNGVGRELLARAFPRQGDEPRAIIATADVRAQVRYLKLGLYPHFPMYYFGAKPEFSPLETDLKFSPLTPSEAHINILGDIDKQVLGFRRDVDHQWLLEDRQGLLYYRDGKPVGYGYFGVRNGPFAVLDGRDLPAVLADAINRAVEDGREEFGVEVPMINRHAVDYLLGRGFRIGSLIAFWMSDQPFGDFERYIVTSPPFIL